MCPTKPTSSLMVSCGSVLCFMACCHHVMLLVCRMHFLTLFKRCSLTFPESSCQVLETLKSASSRPVFNPTCFCASLNLGVCANVFCLSGLVSFLNIRNQHVTFLCCAVLSGGICAPRADTRRLDLWALLSGRSPNLTAE